MSKLITLFMSMFIAVLATAQSATLLKEINPNGSSCNANDNRLVHENVLYFIANNGTTGRELWRTDGTSSGTYLFKEFIPGAAGVAEINFTILDGQIIMGVAGNNSFSIWKSDGTEQGTVLVKNIVASGEYPDWLSRLVVANGLVFFVATDSTNGVELWATDGTEAGTKMVKNISDLNIYTPLNLVSWNNNCYFYHGNTTTGYELYRSDGTDAGTALVKDINPGWNNSHTGNSNEFDIVSTPLGVFFTAYNNTLGQELWLSDGTEAGTKVVKEINPSDMFYLPGAQLNGNNFNARNYVFWNGRFYFNGKNASDGIELWATDGTEAGTVMVKDAMEGSGDLILTNMVALSNKIIYTAQTVSEGEEIWVSDGTAAGTKIVKDISFSFGDGVAWNSDLKPYAGKVWFSGNGGTSGFELFRTDGTEAGTVMVQNINPGSEHSYPGGFEQVGNKLVFFAGAGGTYVEPYVLFDPAVSGITESFEQLFKITASPNPTTGILRVSTDALLPAGTRLHVYSLMGTWVHSENWATNGQALDLRQLPAGTYSLFVTDQQGLPISSTKFIMN
jgi:trimeric autotransporter adhesin